MKKTLVLVGLVLAGCPAATTKGTSNLGVSIKRCPDPTTDCSSTNGPRVTGVVVTDAPATVTSVRLQSGETIVVH